MCIVSDCMEMAKSFCESENFKPTKVSKWPMEKILGGIIWILRTGAQWRSLPKDFPPRSTVHRWFQDIGSEGIILKVLQEWIGEIYKVFPINHTFYIDGMFVEAKGGGDGVGNTKCGKGTKVMVLTSNDLIPAAICVGSANPHELKYISQLLDNKFIKNQEIKKMIGDKAYDSDSHDKQLLDEKGIELIAPHRKNKKIKTQDGRKLRGYKKKTLR